MPKWTTAKGKKIEVDDMTDSHVLNAFNIMMKKGGIPLKRAVLKILIAAQEARENTAIVKQLGPLTESTIPNDIGDK